MNVILSFIDGNFKEGQNNDEQSSGQLEIDTAQMKATLTFSEDAGLITRRTASRQAESVCRTGFLLQTGERVGVGAELEVVEGDRLSEAHLREGHKYNRE